MTRAAAEDEELDDDELDADEAWEEWEDWDEEDAAPEAPKGRAARRSRGAGGLPTVRPLSIGFLAMLPLFACYELALAASGGAYRNTSELLVGRALVVFEPWSDEVRWSALAAGALVAFFHVRLRRWRVRAGLFRTALEGAVAAFAFGPAVVALLSLAGDLSASVRVPLGPPESLPGLQRTGLLFGAAAYEELLFRVLGYSLLYLVARRTATFLGARPRLASWIGDGVGLAGSALAFASIHLEPVVRWLGSGGESFDVGLFAWRVASGVLLGLLFRWRGPGVAAWTHGVFNVALVLGAGPAVFL